MWINILLSGYQGKMFGMQPWNCFLPKDLFTVAFHEVNSKLGSLLERCARAIEHICSFVAHWVIKLECLLLFHRIFLTRMCMFVNLATVPDKDHSQSWRWDLCIFQCLWTARCCCLNKL